MVPIELLLSFLNEDMPHGDVTSEAIIPIVRCRARIIAKQAGMVAGLKEAEALFGHFYVVVEHRTKDGTWVAPGEELMILEGEARAILLLERTVLNIIGRMSGIATMTRRMVERARLHNPVIRIAATRKTCPGLRRLDKKAVVTGGGEPHRFSLSDLILIKDNHLALVPFDEALQQARAWSRYKKVEIEVSTAEDAVRAAESGADIIMLDNMAPEAVQETARVLREKGLRERVVIEVSGGISEETVDEYAKCDIDVISAGALTHSVTNFDVSLAIIPGEKTVRI
jgi:nicotinate-nucleotide pyrophosphorylase (carboxylating)